MRGLSRSRLVVVAVVAVAALTFGAVSATGGGRQGSAAAVDSVSKGPSSRAKLERNKKNVVGYYTLAFNDQKPAEAVAKYVGPVYIQHNPLAADGPQAFIDFVTGFVQQFPQTHVDIRRVIAEGDLVVTHSHFTTSPEDRGSAVVDIFRLNKQGKIVEHWDVIQQIPETSANDNTMF